MLVVLLTLVGCSTFEHDWRAAESYAFSNDGLDGRWEGTWKSDVNGHNGRLRALITRQSENCYHAHFKASYAYILPYEFELPLYVNDEGDIYTFEGQADLGWLAGGLFSYSGQADDCHFTAAYCSRDDHGYFTMTRLPSCATCYEEHPGE